ncbi:unnamed protein product [Clavelina lepadiformis]|uniref:Malate dehydrogenase n=1 Tax=Clavelina lepadiformis TaxID=159417 RepID=A0ABP0H117_CLALP
MASTRDLVYIPISRAKSLVQNCLKAVGAKESHAEDLADVLVAGDHRGHYSHGLNRLDMYVKDIQTGITNGDAEPITERETPATAMVDGKNVLGPVVGKYCMNLAIKKAKECGVGWVLARQSNHYGIAGYYSLMASSKGLIGMSMTNTSSLVLGTRAKSCTLGTNPVSFATPGKSGDNFVLDMATSTVALGKVELQKRKDEKIPNGWGADKDGIETNVPGEVLRGGGLLPLGGSEETGGYKGYGLAMMVEIMTSIMSGATYGANVRKWGTTERIADLGQCFIAVDPNVFCPGFNGRLQDYLSLQRDLEPADSTKPVLVPGDPEVAHQKICDEMGGIPYHKNVVKHLADVAARLNVEAMDI